MFFHEYLVVLLSSRQEGRAVNECAHLQYDGTVEIKGRSAPQRTQGLLGCCTRLNAGWDHPCG